MTNLEDEWSRYLTNTEEPSTGSDVESMQSTEYVSNFSDLSISTKTKVLFLNQPIQIVEVFWNIPITEYWKPECGVIKKQMKVVSKDPDECEKLKNRLKSVPYYTENIIKQVDNPLSRKTKFKDERKITIGISRKDIVNSRGKVKNAFYNCFAMILRFEYETKYKEIHVKVFNTGKLEIPGILNTGLLTTVKSMILDILQPYMPEPIVFIEPKGEEGSVLINSNFNCGFFINRDKLHTILRSDKYGIEAAYDPCSYPGVKCKYYFNNELGANHSLQNGQISTEDRNMKMSELIDNKKYTEVSFMVFRTGSGLIVGNCSDKVLDHIFEFIRRVLENEYDNIHVSNETVIIKDKTLKIRKRTVTITSEYYAKIQAS